MPEKFKEKLLFAVINAILTLTIMFIILGVTNRGGKADVDYVDKKDAIVQKSLDDYKYDHKQIHEMTDKYLERMMDFWDIQYEDLKDEVDER